MLGRATKIQILSALIAAGSIEFGSLYSLQAQTAQGERLVVTGEEVPSSYGATPGFSRSRFSNLTQAYVLPPGAVFAGLIYQGDALRFNRPDHMLTQEIEIGLPARFGIAFENSIESFRGHTQERTFSIEGRYALADWNKIPLNPTIFVEYKFGIGNILHDEGPPEPLPKGEAEEFLAEHERLPDAVEVRLLLAQDFSHNVEWALNGFFEQEVGGDRGREVGFAQSLMFPIIAERTPESGRGNAVHRVHGRRDSRGRRRPVVSLRDWADGRLETFREYASRRLFTFRRDRRLAARLCFRCLFGALRRPGSPPGGSPRFNPQSVMITDC
jgi:hypothetical protein